MHKKTMIITVTAQSVQLAILFLYYQELAASVSLGFPDLRISFILRSKELQ